MNLKSVHINNLFCTALDRPQEERMLAMLHSFFKHLQRCAKGGDCHPLLPKGLIFCFEASKHYRLGADLGGRPFLKDLTLPPAKRSLGPVFSKVCLQCEIFGQNKVFIVFLECSKNQFAHPKNKSAKFSKIVGKSAPPPPENSRSAPATRCKTKMSFFLIR